MPAPARPGQSGKQARLRRQRAPGSSRERVPRTTPPEACSITPVIRAISTSSSAGPTAPNAPATSPAPPHAPPPTRRRRIFSRHPTHKKRLLVISKRIASLVFYSGSVNCRTSQGKRQGKRLLFVNKKKQKNFIHLPPLRHPERSEGSTISHPPATFIIPHNSTKCYFVQLKKLTIQQFYAVAGSRKFGGEITFGSTISLLMRTKNKSSFFASFCSQKEVFLLSVPLPYVFGFSNR